MKDCDHLNTLATLHYVYAVLVAFFACLPLLHVGAGIFLILGSPYFPSFETGLPVEAILPFYGILFIVMGLFASIIGWIQAGLAFLAAHLLEQRRRRKWVMVLAAIDCINMPLGLALGVFTLVVLSRRSAAALFES